VDGGGANLNVNTSVNLVHTYEPESSRFKATTSAGFQFEDRDLRLSQVTGRFLLGTLEQPYQAATVVSAGSRQRVRDVGAYVQEELLLLDQALSLTASVRGDRSSNNADADHTYYYPKLAAAYSFPRSFGPIESLKLRTAYGASGNEPLYGQRFTPLTVNNTEAIPSVIINGGIGAPDLRPERVTEIEGGFDATMFGQRALLTVTAYRRNITDLLLSRGLALSSGFTTQFFNGGEMESKGIELSLRGTFIQRENLEWTSTTTFSHNRTEVTNLPVPQFSAGNSFGTGFGSFLITNGFSPTTVFANDNGTGVAAIGESEPDFQMGFLNDIRFGRFSLSGLVDWSKGGLVVNLTRNYYDAAGTSPDWYNPAEWDSEGDFTPIAWEECGLGCASGAARDYFHARGYATYVEPAGFVKIREISVTYDIPERILGNRVNHAQLQFSGRNLKTWTDYSGYDPEVSNFGNVAAGRNQDVTPYPPSRSFWVGINLGF
jgi:outer membrane receptor protein involved in Fe transport